MLLAAPSRPRRRLHLASLVRSVLLCFVLFCLVLASFRFHLAPSLLVVCRRALRCPAVYTALRHTRAARAASRKGAWTHISLHIWFSVGAVPDAAGHVPLEFCSTGIRREPPKFPLASLHRAFEKAIPCQSKAEERPPERRAPGEQQPPVNPGSCPRWRRE